MERIVLDTNILLVCISNRSKTHWVFQSLLEGKYTLCVSTDNMLDEYAEIIERHISPLASEAVLGVLMNLPNLERIHTYFRFNLLDDPDDNKFVDCAIASNARFIVSHGRDFRKLRETKFLSVKVISADDFRKILDV